MAKDQGIVQTAMRRRTALRATPQARALEEQERKRPINPVQFLREVQAEFKKISWPSWKETWITSAMVGIMVVTTSVFFFGVDGVLHFAVSWVLQTFANAG